MKLLKQVQTLIEQKRVGSIGHDEAVLEQSNFWVRSITWGLIGTTYLWSCVAGTCKNRRSRGCGWDVATNWIGKRDSDATRWNCF